MRTILSLSLSLALSRFLFLALLLPMVIAAAEPVAGGYFHKFYTGKIGEKYSIKMDIKNLDGVLSGKYRYAGKSDDLYLQGKIEPSGSFTMDEISQGKHTAVFTGVMTAKQISGEWRSADGRKKWSFAADQASEIIIGSKREILTRAIGEYTLRHISGSGGANGMWDTWKETGGWQSNSSGISEGRRETSDVGLIPADIRLLDSLKVKVDADLTTTFLAQGKAILSIPYLAGGMQVDMQNEHNEIAMEGMKKLSPSTTVYDERLFLIEKDGVDYSNAISGNFVATVSDIVVVSYSVVKGTFRMQFIEGNCCGGSTFTFARSNSPQWQSGEDFNDD